MIEALEPYGLDVMPDIIKYHSYSKAVVVFVYADSMMFDAKENKGQSFLAAFFISNNFAGTLGW